MLKNSRFQKQPPEAFYKKSCSKKYGNLHRKIPVLRSVFKNKVAGFQVFLSKETLTQVFLCEYCEIVNNNTYFEEHLPKAASEI